jgi:hypothetical protein
LINQSINIFFEKKNKKLNFDEMSSYFSNCINKLKMANLKVYDAISAMLEKFEPGMVHLTRETR